MYAGVKVMLMAVLSSMLTTNWTTIGTFYPNAGSPGSLLYVTPRSVQTGVVVSNVVADIAWSDKVVQVTLESHTVEYLRREIPQDGWVVTNMVLTPVWTNYWQPVVTNYGIYAPVSGMHRVVDACTNMPVVNGIRKAFESCTNVLNVSTTSPGVFMWDRSTFRWLEDE